MAENENTENKILEAAKRVFIRKGMDGARMQEIADEAGINKALLHYYFRSKDMLFRAVFQVAFQFFVPRIIEKTQTDLPFFDKIRFFVHTYCELIESNPYLPVFIMNEINRDPSGLLRIIRNSGVKPELIIAMFDHAYEEGLIKKTDGREIFLNIIALCVFPYAARPLVEQILFNSDKAAYNVMLERRKSQVAEMIINDIKAS